MATSYPMPDWLRPPDDPGRTFLSAFSAGANIATEQARLQHESERTAVAAAERAQVAQQDALQQQQKIEIEKAYHQSQIGLRRQELDQAQQKIQQSAQAAAKRFQAQQTIKAKIASGMPADEAFLSTPEAFSSVAGVAPLIKARESRLHPFAPEYKEVGPGIGMVRETPNQWRLAPRTQAASDAPAQPVIGPDGQPVPGMLRVPNSRGGWDVRNVPRPAPTAAEKELAQLKKQQDADIVGASLAERDEKELGTLSKSTRKRYLERAARIAELQKQMAQATPTAASNRYTYDPKSKKLAPVVPAHTEAADETGD